MSRAKRYRSLGDARRNGGEDVWQCGKRGRCMPCGWIHNFGREQDGQWIDVFLCTENVHRGCPLPEPLPVHDWGKRKCRRCGTARPDAEPRPPGRVLIP